MQTTGWRLGPHESRLLTWAQVRKVDCARTEKVAQALHLSGDQTTQLLSRMQKRGLIVQLQRGLYLLPRNLPPGGKTLLISSLNYMPLEVPVSGARVDVVLRSASGSLDDVVVVGYGTQKVTTISG